MLQWFTRKGASVWWLGLVVGCTVQSPPEIPTSGDPGSESNRATLTLVATVQKPAVATLPALALTDAAVAFTETPSVPRATVPSAPWEEAGSSPRA